MNGIVTFLPGKGTTTVSRAPSITGVIPINSTTVEISYTSPPVFFSGPINYYSAISNPSGATATTTSTSSISVSGLQPFVCYTFNVSASNVYGSSPYSANSPVFKFGVPNPPIIQSAVVSGAELVNVYGTVYSLISPCGLPVNSISAISTPGCITTTTNLSSLGTVSLGYSTNCFVACGTYTFQLYLTNAVGNSSLTTSSNSVTIEPPYQWSSITITGNSVLTAIPTTGGNYVLAFVSNASVPLSTKWYAGTLGSSLSQISVETSYFSVPRGIIFNNNIFYGYWYNTIAFSGTQPPNTEISVRSLLESFATMVSDNLYHGPTPF